MTANIISIDSENEDERCFLVNILDDENYSPNVIIDKEEIRKATDDMLDRLKVKEKEILKQRFAFNESKKATLKTVAKNLGISPETVRQIEIRTIKKIRINFPHLRDYLYD